MWPTFKDQSSDDNKKEEEQRRPLSFDDLVKQIGNFNDFRSNNSALKFWLPSPAKEALDLIIDREGVSLTEFVRRFLVIHCYGLYAFYAMRDANKELFKDINQGPSVFYQEAPVPSGKVRIKTYWVPELGKNIVPIKVWIPYRLHLNLKELADQAGITTSNYVREILISRLLGQGMLPTRPQMFTPEEAEAGASWCKGEEAAWRQISQEETSQHSAWEDRDMLVDE